MQDPILIVGAARSGTSLVAGIASRCGAWHGKLSSSPGPHNPKGYFENTMLFGDIRGRMLSQERPANDRAPQACADFNGEKEELQSAYHIPTDKPWFIKMPEIVVWDGQPDWPLWDKYFPEAKWVLVRRNLTDIFASHTQKYGKTRPGTEQILNEMDSLKSYLDETQRDYIDIWPFETLANGAQDFESMVTDLGLGWKPSAVEEFADPALQNQRSNLSHPHI